ncbi:MAG: hypothetical protein O7H41_21320 [Planctomycetota bacterium]|nr:hypothetical protein [Planctomycetota bacterium]
MLNAHGWPVDILDDEILEELLALNLERADADETRSTLMWDPTPTP